jgi:8-oxo-dGTP diphosphatase
VLRRGSTPLIAVVRQRKRNEWVLPKGKLDDGETPKEAAHREVLEETGHDVAVHEFLGTLVYQSGGRSKVVHFWRMEADGGPVRKLTNDIKAVEWLTLDDAIGRLSREYERTFLTQIGPIALAAAGPATPEAAPAADVDAALQTLTPAEIASVGALRHGLLQKVKAWLRGEA